MDFFGKALQILKLESLGQPADGEDLMILACTVFAWSTRVTDRRTDGRTELQWLRRAIAVPAVARKNEGAVPLRGRNMASRKSWLWAVNISGVSYVIIGAQFIESTSPNVRETAVDNVVDILIRSGDILDQSLKLS